MSVLHATERALSASYVHRGEGQKVTFEPITEYVVGKCFVVVRKLHVHTLSLEKTLCRRLMHMHALTHV